MVHMYNLGKQKKYSIKLLSAKKMALIWPWKQLYIQIRWFLFILAIMSMMADFSKWSNIKVPLFNYLLRCTNLRARRLLVVWMTGLWKILSQPLWVPWAIWGEQSSVRICTETTLNPEFDYYVKHLNEGGNGIDLENLWEKVRYYVIALIFYDLLGPSDMIWTVHPSPWAPHRATYHFSCLSGHFQEAICRGLMPPVWYIFSFLMSHLPC